MPIKVMHVIGDLQIGGAETNLLRLVSRLDPKEFESRIAVLRPGEGDEHLTHRFREAGIPVHPLYGISGMGAVKTVIGLWKLSRGTRPNIIQGWMYHGNLAAGAAKLFRFGKSRVAWNIRHSMHDAASDKRATRFIRGLNRSLSRFADAIVYNSNVSATQHGQSGFSTQRTTVIPNGFDLSLFHASDEARSHLMAELGFPDNALLIGHIARYHPAKDHATLIKAARGVVDRHPSARFVLVGHDVTPANQDLVARIAQQALGHSFHLLGERHDIPEIVSALDVLVLSSAGEAFPTVLGEAMASEVVCVATDVGDSAWIVGETGRIVPPHDPSGLGNALAGVLDLPPTERRRLGAAARERIRNNFSIERMVEDYRRLYRSLATSSLP